jgi:ABC-type multidrug transport system ATPase subunit
VSSVNRVIECRQLRMRYGHKDVLAGVDFDVAAGETVALLGPNGAGKTTTIEVLEGFRNRSAGLVSVFGVGMTLASRAVHVTHDAGLVRVYLGRELLRELLLGPKGTYHGNGQPRGRPRKRPEST